MAENTTTYKAIIETEVKGTKDIDEMNKKMEEGEGKFKSLKTQIRETTVALQKMADEGKESTKEFKTLSNQLDELGDQQKKVAFQSSQIEDKLAALPGPIGAIGKGFASAKGAVETFGLQLAIATGGITLIIGAVIAMKDAMSKTAEGQETLNKVTEALGKITAPIFALFEKVGIPIFLKFAEVVGWLGNKINDFVKWLGVAQSKVNEIATEGNKAFYDAAQKDLDNMKTVLDYQKSLDEKAKAAATERKRKYLEQQEELQREADEKEKRSLEKQLSDMEKLRKKMAGNLTTIESDSLKNRTSTLKKEEDEKIKRAAATAETIRLLGINSIKKQDAWAKTHQTSAFSKEVEAKTTQVKKLSKLETFLTSEKKKNLDAQLVAAKAALELAGGLVDEHSAAGKAIAVTLAVINTYQGATAALASLPPPISFIAAAATIAAGLMNVNKILTTQIPSAKGEGGTVGGGSAPSVDIAMPSIPQLTAPDVNIGGGQNPTSQIAQSLNAASGKPIKAYVVSGEVSSQQALDRRTNRAATLSGGY